MRFMEWRQVLAFPVKVYDSQAVPVDTGNLNNYLTTYLPVYTDLRITPADNYFGNSKQQANVSYFCCDLSSRRRDGRVVPCKMYRQLQDFD